MRDERLKSPHPNPLSEGEGTGLHTFQLSRSRDFSEERHGEYRETTLSQQETTLVAEG